MYESRFWLRFFGGFADFLFQNLSKVSYLVPVLDTGPQKNQQYQKIHIGYGLCLCDPVSSTGTG